MTTFTAAIGTASDVVLGDFCDVTVAEDDVISYRFDEDGNEIPLYGMSDRIVMEPIETDVRVDDDESLQKVEAAAREVLEDNGWKVTGTWESGGNALYASVERA